MAKIFISYRREDSQHPADRLHAALSRKIPKRNIFIDVDNIPVGVDFVQHLDQQVAQCDVLLALIGPDWLEAKNPQTGLRRLDDPKDIVRLAIASALKRGIPVVPVQLDGAPFPPEERLPEELRALTRRIGVEVRRLSFDADAERLMGGLDLTRAAAATLRAAIPKIFISYRRDDAQWQTKAVYDALSKHVADPRENIFFDLDSMTVGLNFKTQIDLTVAKCDVLLAVIGRGWLNAADPDTGVRRLNDPRDFVRAEIAAALKRDIPVVPILLDGVSVPDVGDLPEDIRELSMRHGVKVRADSFDNDVNVLIRALNLAPNAPVVQSTAVRQRRSSLLGANFALVALGVLAIGGGAWAWFGNPGDWRGLGPADMADRRALQLQATAADPAPAAALEHASPAPEVAMPRARETFRDCSDCPEMVSIPAGSFMMGSLASESGRGGDESPQRRVTVPAFAAGKFEVTWAEWDRCVTAGGCASLQADGFGGGSRPVTNVTWPEAVAYTKWLSNRTGKTYRLLSEAEWEYAARATSNSPYPWGSTASHQYANYGKDACCGGLASGRDQWINTSPAGSFDANMFGLHDMHGNVWEWVQDCYADDYASGQPSNGGAYSPSTCSGRVLRGGSWDSLPPVLRSAIRSRGNPTFRYDILGFRVARTF